MNRTTLQQLCRPDAFNHRVDRFSLRETHISWVILCGDFAYKIKKPVNFGFLDFSTLEQRHHFCQRELELNSRFAPELYLDVVPITGGPRGPRIDGRGKIIDYAVKMRRFDEAQLLDNVASRGELGPRLIRSLARELSRLHRVLPACHPDPDSSEPGTPVTLKAAIEQNFRQIEQFPLADTQHEQLLAVQRWSLEHFAVSLPLMQRRVTDGWIIDGHGDVHLGNIALIDGRVRLFDCIEFNPEFRIMDSIGEIGLLTMDLEARDHPGESHLLLTDYLEYRGDFRGLALLDLYRSYYAMVRAKVNLLRENPDQAALHQTEAYREMSRYLALAHRYCQPPGPFLAITHGVSGSGKSTVAAGLVAESGAVRIRSDVERKRLFGLQPEERSNPGDEVALYSVDMSRKTFDRLEQLAKQIIDAGMPVIVDATFLHRRVRDSFRELASRLGVPFAIIECVADPQELKARLIERDRHRRDASEAGVAVMEQQLEQLEPLSAGEMPFRIEADSSEEPSLTWERLEGVLHGPTGAT